MSWWVGVEIDTGGPETVMVSDRNVTYNVSPVFYRVLAHPDGLRGFNGAPASEAGGIFAAAATRLAGLPADEVRELVRGHGDWGSQASAVADLEWLAGECAAHPKGTVYVH